MRFRPIFESKIPRILRVEAIVLWPFMLFAGAKDDYKYKHRLLRHELQHAYQIVEHGVIKFYVTYLWEYFRNYMQYRDGFIAYREISYELDARDHEYLPMDEDELDFYELL